MKRKIYAAAFLVMLTLALTGCQLAREDMSVNGEEDKLVGVFVTTEYLDLFDMERYLNDNIKELRGGDITVGGNTEKYQERLYATLTSKALTSDETGDIFEIDDYVFPIEGISCFSATVPAKGNHESYLSSMYDPAICDMQLDYNVGDDASVQTLKGTIYVSPNGMEHSFYFNPVYQSADGSVYLMAGSGITSQMDREGTTMSQNMEASTTTTENGKTKSESISITLSVSAMFAPTKIVVLQISEESAVLSRMEYEPGAMPEFISTEQKANYLIVETHKRDETGQTKISREICGSDAESFETFLAREDGICVKQGIQVKWPE